MKRLLALMLVLSLVFAHEARVQNAWIRLVPGPNLSAYVTLTNPALKESLKIVGASSSIATKVSFHKTEMDGMDMSSMKPMASVSIPPKGTVEFKPGGMHIMLEGIKGTLKVGQKVNIVLKFDDGDTQSVEFVVKAQ